MDLQSSLERLSVGDEAGLKEGNAEISEVKELDEEEKEKQGKEGNQAKDDKLKGTKKEKKSKGESSSQVLTPTPPEEDKNKGKKPEGAEITEEDKGNPNIIYPGKFDITWGNDEKYWEPLDKSSKDPAELKQVCWLQVTGSKKVTKGKSYEIKFNITLKANAFGWNGLPLFLMAKIGTKGKSIWKKIKPLEQTTTDQTFDIPNTDEKFVVTIPADKGNKEQELFFGLYEIWSGKWKGGLQIHHATVQED